MLSLDTVQPLLTTAFQRFLQHVQGADAPGTDPLPDTIRTYFRAKAELGSANTAEKVGLHEQELKALEAAARDVERTLNALERGGKPGERNAVLAQVRLLSWLETCDRHVPVQLIDADLDALISTEVGHKQVRALELIVRSLITESYESQDKLIGRLREALNERVVQQWEAKADPGDILSGLTFSELASLFVNKQEFERYEDFYEDTPFLTLLKQRRRTIQAFLEDVRRIRNTLAHNKKVTNTQLSLLDLYYEEIVDPVQTAYDQGETKVDPGTYLEVDAATLDKFTSSLREDLDEVRDDLADFRKSVEEKLGVVAADTEAIRETTEGINSKLIAVGVGVCALIVAAFFILKQGDETQDKVDTARKASERTEKAAKASTEASKGAEKAAKESTEASKDAAEAAKSAEKATKEATEVVKESAKETKEAAEAAKEAAEKTAKSTERIAESLESLKEGFAALTKEGGVIADANRASAHYHNARIYEQRGDTAKAMESYRQFFTFPDQGFIDPHLRYQQLLKLQNGLGGAREIYHAMKERSKSPVAAFAWMLLLPQEARVEQLEKVAADKPDFAPVHYELSRDYSVARLGSQTLADKRAEKKHLEAFLKAQESDGFLRHYLDQSVAGKHVEDAKERLTALSSVAEAVLENPVTLSATQSNSSWMVTLMVAELTKEIFVKVGDGAFKSTGHMPNVHPQTGMPMARQFFEMPLGSSKATIQVKYTDPKGKEHGPYELHFDPDAQAIASSKNILNITKSSWLYFRDYDGKLLVYFSHVLGHRGALREIRYGWNKDTPDTVFPFNAPDPKNPHAIGANDTIYLSIPKTTKWGVIQLTFKDGSKSEIVRVNR